MPGPCVQVPAPFGAVEGEEGKYCGTMPSEERERMWFRFGRSVPSIVAVEDAKEALVEDMYAGDAGRELHYVVTRTQAVELVRVCRKVSTMSEDAQIGEIERGRERT